MIEIELILNVSYVIAAFLFILGLKLLSSPGTAKIGNTISALGMLIAVLVTLIDRNIISYYWIILGLGIGTIIGVGFVRSIEMTKIPQLVSLFNGFGGLASLLVAFGSLQYLLVETASPFHINMVLVIIFLSIFVGGLTFSGSVVAWAKLDQRISQNPFIFPGVRWLKFIILLAILTAAYEFVVTSGGSLWAYLTIVLSLLLGFLAVMPIGGADMPIVISLLNSFSGLAVCAVGLAIGNGLLVIAGLFVGASGTILTNVMCKAINRSILNVLFSGFGQQIKIKDNEKIEGNVKSISPNDAFYMLEAAQSVVVIPGYGMAVAQAQHALKELQDTLEGNGTEVAYAIHPVAGRMPGHMNVLLAEADVAYDQQFEMDVINPKMAGYDIAIVIGANDVVNTAAKDVEGCPIYGMPIIEVGLARSAIFIKRSMAPGFSGVDNPIFYEENTRMLFGDAKESLHAIVREFRS